jgi:branched-chain amino acid transport system ATP-binding protein
MTEAPALLRLEAVDKRFGQVVVAAQVSVSVESGQLVGIVGPNGAGKTSLFGLVSGDLSPDSGSVLLLGRDVTALDAGSRCRLGIGRTYQVPRSFEGMSTFENVLVAAQQGASLHGEAAYDLALAVLEQTGLLELVNRRALTLTLLQRKRLEIARALATAPKLLLLDEVAGGLTDAEVETVVEIVKGVRASGITVIWIEHVVRALTSTVDRLLCLAGGRIIADGDARSVLASEAVKEVYLGVDFERAGRTRAADASVPAERADETR